MESTNDWKEVSDKAYQAFEDLLNSTKWQEFNKNNDGRMLQISFEDRVASRGEALILVPYQEVVDFILDPNCIKYIDKMLERNELLHSEEGIEISYLKYKGMFPVSARDFVILTMDKQVSEGRYIFASTSVKYKKGEESGVVRATVKCAGYEILDLGEGKTKVTYISDADPSGSLPGFIKTMVSKGQAEVPFNLKRYLEAKKK